MFWDAGGPLDALNTLSRISENLSNVIHFAAYVSEWKSVLGSEKEAKSESLVNKKRAKQFWYKYVQQSPISVLKAPAGKKEDGKEQAVKRDASRLNPADSSWRQG